MDKETYTTENNFYQTGDVCPPKSHRGIIAALLIAVIFLGGLVSGLSLLNIRLFRQLKAQESAPVRFVTGSTEATHHNSSYNPVDISPLGFTGCILTSFDRHYYDLPAGVYITEVSENSHAAAKGICAGDILLQIDECHITDLETLQAQLGTYPIGKTVSLVIYRNGGHYRLDIPIS